MCSFQYAFAVSKDLQCKRVTIVEEVSQAELEVKVTPHTFRYSVATHLSDLGADIRHIQEFMRHESLDTTANYIRHGIQKLREVHKTTHPRG